MFPTTLALVDDDTAYTDYLSPYLRDLGIRVDVFADSNDLLAHTAPFDYVFYVIDLMLPGIDGVDLIRVIRKRSDAGLLVVSGRFEPEAFKAVMTAGADMYLAKPVQFEQIALAIQAVHRRSRVNNPNVKPWTLDRRTARLCAPDNEAVELSPADLAVLDCFVKAGGEVVSRETLAAALGNGAAASHAGGGESSLNATIFRLRRRIERATPLPVPLQTRSRQGYVFVAPIKVI